MCDRERTLAVNLNDGGTGGPSIVVHFCRSFGVAGLAMGLIIAPQNCVDAALIAFTL